MEMEGHVAHLDHDIAGQSCGAEPEDHRRADQIRDHRTANHQAGKRRPKAIASLTMLGLWSWPPPAAAAAPVPPHEPSPARSSSSPASSNPFKSSNGEAFLGRMSGLCSWESGKGRSSLASRNNGVLPITVGGSKGFPSGEDEDKMAFLFF